MKGEALQILKSKLSRTNNSLTSPGFVTIADPQCPGPLPIILISDGC
jgi:hypothetical protein